MTDEKRKLVQKTVEILDACIDEFRKAGFEDRPTGPDQAPIIGFHLGDIIANKEDLENLLLEDLLVTP